MESSIKLLLKEFTFYQMSKYKMIYFKIIILIFFFLKPSLSFSYSYLEIQKLIKEGKVQDALETALKLANEGNIEAQRIVGYIYTGAYSAKAPISQKIKNIEKAKYWWDIAAKSGDTYSQYSLALMYIKGDGVEINPKIIENWLLESSMGGYRAAMILLGKLYLEGETLALNLPLGYMWLKTAMLNDNYIYSNFLSKYFTHSSNSSQIFKLKSDAITYTWPTSNVIGEDIIGRDDRDEYMTYFIQKMMTYVVGEQGILKHPSVDHPGEKIRLSLRDIGVKINRAFHLKSDKNQIIFWILYNKRFKLDRPEYIAVNKSFLWDIVRPGDFVELSDRTTSHLTLVFKIDRIKDIIYFIDPWPTMFFLQQGRNAAGVKSKSLSLGISRKILSINKNEYLKVIRGTLTIGKVEFINKLLASFPNLKSDPIVQLGIGTSLVNSRSKIALKKGVSYLWNIITNTKNQDILLKAIDHLVIGIDKCILFDIEMIPNVMKESQNVELVSLTELEDYISSLDKDSLFLTLGIDGWHTVIDQKIKMNKIQEALSIVDKSLNIYPTAEILFISRANINIIRKKYKIAIDDLNIATIIIENKLLNSSSIIIDIYGNISGAYPEKEELNILLHNTILKKAKINLQLGNFKQSIKYSKRVLEKHPDSIESLSIIETAYTALEKPNEAKIYSDKKDDIEVRNMYKIFLNY